MGEKRMHGFPSREQALRDFFEAWECKHSTELVSLDEAVGRVCSETLYSHVTLPVYRASACDGIAVRSSDFVNGLPDTTLWQYGEDYIRADTGDDFDDRFDAVIMIEKAVVQENGSVCLDEDVSVEPGTNVRLAGDTIRKGTLLLEAGLPIRPTDLAALILGGTTMVPVRRKPRIAFIPTGSELVPAGIRARRGQNIDTNSLLVKHLLMEYGAEPVIFPIVRDDESALEEAFLAAVQSADVVVINGGSAVGAEDFNVRLIEGRGTVIHHYIAAAPGRPLMLAVVNGKPVIDLPGPTLAAYFGSEWCLQATVNRLLGLPMPEKRLITARLTEDMRTSSQMAIICRMHVARDDQGNLTAAPLSFREPDAMARCMTSNAQRVSPIGESSLAKDDLIEVELLRNMAYIVQEKPE